jgi:hypothetical protein
MPAFFVNMLAGNWESQSSYCICARATAAFTPAAGYMIPLQEGLSVIVHAIEVSRAIFARMKNFINYR